MISQNQSMSYFQIIINIVYIVAFGFVGASPVKPKRESRSDELII